MLEGRQHHVKSRVQQSVIFTACAWLQCEANPKISVIVPLFKTLWELSHPVPVLLYSTAASIIVQVVGVSAVALTAPALLTTPDGN